MLAGRPPYLIICSKSNWTPAIRREHALAAEAARDGAEVTFLERPLDVRSLLTRDNRSAWLRGVCQRPQRLHPVAGVTIRSRSTIIPGHRSSTALMLESFLLERSLRRIPYLREATVVAMLPWQWPAVARVPASRRVLDYTDDWEALVPGRESAMRHLLARVEREADAITVVSSDLGKVFSHRRVSVVRNGVSDDVLALRATPPPRASRIAYLGTLSDRFDVSLVADVLGRLPDSWTIDLYGPCQYPHNGDRPSDDLESLLEHPRVTWHGPVERDRVAMVLDNADVLVVPHRRIKPNSNRAHPSWRGDVMKLYDYAARGRPIVSTNYTDGLSDTGPPQLYLADEPSKFAESVQRAAHSSAASLSAQREWAAEHAWSQRWSDWKAATRFAEPVGNDACAR